MNTTTTFQIGYDITFENASLSGPLQALTLIPDAPFIAPLLTTLVVILGLIALQLSLPKKRDAYDISGPISPAGCEAMAVHKYKASDYTILDDLLNPWWAWCASLLPKTLAPNCVTLLGWLFYIPTDIILLSTGTTPLTARPWWVYLLGSWSVFWYQTFDAMDGKQARALGVAGPLGQLVDHGCDAVSTVLVTIMSSAGLRVDVDGYILIAWSLLITFYAANWAEKYTHVLMASVSRFLGVTESQYIAVIMLSIPAFLGPDVWLTPISAVVGKQPFIFTPINTVLHMAIDFTIATAEHCQLPRVVEYLNFKIHNYDLNELPLGWIMIWFIAMGCVGLLLRCFTDVALHIAHDMKKDAADAKKPAPSVFAIALRCVQAYTETLPFFSLLAGGLCWYAYSLPNASIDKMYHGAFFYHPYLSVTAMSFLAVHIICQSIVNGMAYQPNHVFQPTLIPMFLLIALDIAPSFTQDHAPILPPAVHFGLYVVVVVFSILAQMRWALGIVQQIANLFGIYVLKLGKKVPVAPVEKLRREIEARLAKKAN